MSVPDRRTQLFRMAEARRQTQRQLDLIDRRIIGRMTAIIPQPRTQCAGHRRGRGLEPAMFLEQYRANLAATHWRGSTRSMLSPASSQGRTLQSRGCVPDCLRTWCAPDTAA